MSRCKCLFSITVITTQAALHLMTSENIVKRKSNVNGKTNIFHNNYIKDSENSHK